MIKSKITVINTGGTFNKIYNCINGKLEVPKDNLALEEIIKYSYNIDFDVKNIISKDSLDITDLDRKELVETIQKCQNDNIIVIHGTDTMDLSAKFLDEKIKNKKIILTGAMFPVSINKVEATLNFASAIGFLNAKVSNDIYIAMHGSVKNYKQLLKNRKLGQFLNLNY